MGNIMNPDNKFFRGVGKVIDCVFISILWFVFCIPIFTFGASTTAMYYTVHKTIRNDKGYVWRTFWGSFKSNFKQTTIITLILLVIAVVLWIDQDIMLTLLQEGSKMGYLYFAFIVLLCFLYVWAVYIFSYSARFEDKLKTVLKNSISLAIVHLPSSFFMLVILAVASFVAWLIPPLLLILPCLICLLNNLFLERIFRKYMSEEDLAKELEDDYINRD